jgi:hypothetical protein
MLRSGTEKWQCTITCAVGSAANPAGAAPPKYEVKYSRRVWSVMPIFCRDISDAHTELYWMVKTWYGIDTVTAGENKKEFTRNIHARRPPPRGINTYICIL